MKLHIKIWESNGQFIAHIECGGSAHGCRKPSPQEAVEWLLNDPLVWMDLVKADKAVEAWLPAVRSEIKAQRARRS